MRAWELAEILLRGNDFPVLVNTVNGFEEIQKIVYEDRSHEVIDYEGSYKILKKENNDPGIVLISKSFGLK